MLKLLNVSLWAFLCCAMLFAATFWTCCTAFSLSIEISDMRAFDDSSKSSYWPKCLLVVRCHFDFMVIILEDWKEEIPHTKLVINDKNFTHFPHLLYMQTTREPALNLMRVLLILGIVLRVKWEEIQSWGLAIHCNASNLNNCHQGLRRRRYYTPNFGGTFRKRKKYKKGCPSITGIHRHFSIMRFYNIITGC